MPTREPLVFEVMNEMRRLLKLKRSQVSSSDSQIAEDHGHGRYKGAAATSMLIDNDVFGDDMAAEQK
jgi:hypothetical protein